MDLRDERELALQRLRILCHSGLFSILDFRSASWLHAWLAIVFLISRSPNKRLSCRHNPLNIFAAHEIAGFCDPSMATKMTVQFNLFGGTASACLHNICINCSFALSIMQSLTMTTSMLGWLCSAQVLHASPLAAAVCIAYVRKKACIRRWQKCRACT